MLEQGEIERGYHVDATALNSLVDSRLLRREPRNESVFYEISHDRLTEAIAKNRRPKLPRWVRPAIAASIVFGLLTLVGACRIDAERARAVRAVGVLLGEGLVSRLREVGLADALQGVLDEADIDRSTKNPAVALSLRHEGDILREWGTVKAAREKFTESLEVLDAVQSRAGGTNPELMAERARTLQRIGSVLEDGGQVSEAWRNYDQSVQMWNQVLKSQAGPQQEMDASESWISLGSVRNRMGDVQGAEHAFTEALQLALSVLTAAYDRPQAGHPEFFFEQGRAMQIYADSVLNLANVWGEEPEARAAHALARESLRLRPLSSSARIQVGSAAAFYGAVILGTPNSVLPPKLFPESRQQFDELAQWDPGNRLLQRESAALQLLISEKTVTCAEMAACRARLGRGELEAAEIAALDSIGRFRWLAGLDSENRSLKQDVAWGLTVQAKVLRALGRQDEALRLLDEAVATSRESVVDVEDVENRLKIPSLFLEKGHLLESGKPLAAIAALDASLAEVDRLPDNLAIVMTTRYNTVDAKIKLLRKLGRTDEAKQLLEDNKRLLERMGDPWNKKRDLATKANAEGLVLHNQMAKLVGVEAAEGFHRALEKYKLAIAEYPFKYEYWRNQRIAYEWIASIQEKLESGAAASDASRANHEAAGTSRVDEREAALRGALTAAWMARVLSDEKNAATSWKALYEARRSLAQFLREHDRTPESLPLVAQGALDAQEYARQQPDSADALSLLADANVGLGLLRLEAKNDGWEEAMREGLAYGDQLAKKEPTKAEHRKWVGEWRQGLGDRLQEAHRNEAAVEEYKLAVQACREALRLAARGPAAERNGVQSCVGELATLATLGYK